MMRSIKVAALALAVFFASVVGTIAAAAKPISLSPEQAESINKISAYMNSFKTLQG